MEDWDSPTGLVTCWDQLKEACYQMIKRAEICNDLIIIRGVKTSALYPQVSHDGKLLVNKNVSNDLMMGKVIVGESIKVSNMLVKEDDSMLAKEDEVLSFVDKQPESRMNMVVKEE